MKKTTTFAIAFALIACNLSLMAAPPVASHEWLNRVAVAIGPINAVEGDELVQELTRNARLVFEKIYEGSSPPIRVTRVAPPVFVDADDPRAVAQLLFKAKAFHVISQEPNGFIAVASLSNYQAWGLIFIVSPKNQILLIVLDLEAIAPAIDRS
jgi:hypothetical protein